MANEIFSYFVILEPPSSIISKRNYLRVLLAKLGKQAIACDETNRLNLGIS